MRSPARPVLAAPPENALEKQISDTLAVEEISKITPEKPDSAGHGPNRPPGKG